MNWRKLFLTVLDLKNVSGIFFIYLNPSNIASHFIPFIRVSNYGKIVGDVTNAQVLFESHFFLFVSVKQIHRVNFPF